MSRKKILYILTKGNWGGAQKYVYDLATALPPEQFEVLVASGEGRELPEKLATTDITALPLPGLERDIRLGSELKIFFVLWRLLRAQRPDVVHLNSSKIGGLGALAARLAGVPRIIFTAHGWPFREARPRWQRALIWLASWVTVILSHQTIVLSESQLRAGQKMPGVKNKLVLIRNGLRPPALLDRAEARERLAELIPGFNPEPEEFLIATIAELHPNKDLPTLLCALKRLENLPWRAIIVGEGEERAKLEHLLRDLDLAKRVYLAGFVPEAATFLPAFDLFALSSMKEGSPYVILEAGAAGLPVVATAVGGVPETVAEDKNGRLAEAGNPESLDNALAPLIRDQALAKSLGETGKQFVENKYSFSHMIENTLALYFKKNASRKISCGFTLIELLVAISIVSLLSTIVMASIQTTRARAQTARRVGDVEQVELALELYRAENGEYPVVTNGDLPLTFAECWECGDNNFYNDDKLPGLIDYLKVRPSDPALPSGGRFSDDSGYWYQSDGTDYKFVSFPPADQAGNIPANRRDSVFRSGRTGIRSHSSDRSRDWTSTCEIQNMAVCPPDDPTFTKYFVYASAQGSGTVTYQVGSGAPETLQVNGLAYPIPATEGSNVSFQFSGPATVTFNGNSPVLVSSFTVPSQAPGTTVHLEINFGNPYNLYSITGTISNPSEGSLSPALPVTVASGGNQTFNLVAPGGGSTAAAISVNGGAPTSYTGSFALTNITANTNLAVTFLPPPEN